MRLLSRVDALAGRFNRWFGSSANAASVELRGGFGGSPPAVGPIGVETVLGELEHGSETEREPDTPHR